MKVVLKQTGQVKEVALGYARNYLFPRGLAVPATLAAIQQNKERQADLARTTAAQQAEYQALAERLRLLPQVNVPAKVNESGTLFAALPAGEICTALKKQCEFDITEEMLAAEPIKNLGAYPVVVTLPHQAPITLTIAVIAK